jgi:hypothetical protein
MSLSMATSGARPLNLFELSILSAGQGLWISANSSQGSVYSVPCTMPVWDLNRAGPAEWLSGAVGLAQREAGNVALEIGRKLRDLVFGVPDIESLFQRARGAATSMGEQLLLRLLVAPGSISAWPWELLIDPQADGQYLTLARDVHVVRAGRLRTYPARADPIDPPLNLLMVMSSPTDEAETPFDLYAEKRSLLTELRPLEDRGLLHIEVEDRPTLDRLRSRLARQRRGFHLVHYLGHAQPAGLRLEMPSGRGGLVSGEKFANLLQQMPDLRLAVFAGCETARAPDDPTPDTWPGTLSVADYCVRDACPMVIGMQAVLPFGTERLFTRFFYQGLTAGQPVAEALRLARLAIDGDQYAGSPLINWVVPALFVGGGLPGPLTDPTARATRQPSQSRVALRLGVRQHDLRFISRLLELRQAIEVLSASNAVRLLQVVGLPATGKSSLLDRAVDELDVGVIVLFISAARLLKSHDAVGDLCGYVAELIRRGGRKPTERGKLKPADWWERLMENLTDVPMVIVIDDADHLVSAGGPGSAILQALSLLTQRRSTVRVAIAAEKDIADLTAPLMPHEIRTIRLQPLSWPDVWQWIRRNLPILTRFAESDLAGFYADLSRLEQWEQLADAIATMLTPTLGDLPAIVDNIAASATAAATIPEPAFGTNEVASGVELASPAHATTASIGALKVAVAGPHTVGRAVQFSRAVTKLAAEKRVSGRVAATDFDNSVSSLAELLGIHSPFEDGAADDFDVALWMQAAVEASADVVVLDFGTSEPNERLNTAVARVVEIGCLVIAAGGNDKVPNYPGWLEDVLAVGAMDEDDLPAEYSPYFEKDRKPDLYANKHLDPAVRSIVDDPATEGTAMSALNVAAAAILVWASDRDLSSREVREVLLETGDSRRVRETAVRRLNIDAALAATRRRLLIDALQTEPLRLDELLAETGLRPEVAIPLIDGLIESNTLNKLRSGDAEMIEDPQSLPLLYARLRNETRGVEIAQMSKQLMNRAAELARRRRYTPEKITRLWDSRDDGRRILALLLIINSQAELGSARIVKEALRQPVSDLEEYLAGEAMKRIWESLSPAEQSEMIAASAMAEGDLLTLIKNLPPAEGLTAADASDNQA